MADVQKERMLLADLCPTIRTVIESGGEFLVYPNGTSMLPTIRPGKDAVLLCRADSVACGDLLLYQRKNGAYVLHRVVKLRKDGSYVLRGDNQFFDEGGIFPSDVVAKVSAIKRGEKEKRTSSLSFRIKSGMRLFFYPLRRFVFRAKNKLRRMLKRNTNGKEDT